MKVEDVIREKLTRAFAPDVLTVRDESHLHKGHAGAPDGGQSHFRVELVSEAFTGQSRVARQRAVYDVLRDELAGPVHALALKTWTPAEKSDD